MEPAPYAAMAPSQTQRGQRAFAVPLGLLVQAGSALAAVLAHSPAQTAQHARHARQDTPALVACVLYVHPAKSLTTAGQYARPAPMASPGRMAHALHAAVAPSQTTTKQLASPAHLDGLATQECVASVPRGQSLRKDD